MNILNKIKETKRTTDKIVLAVSFFEDKEHEFMTECFNNTIYGISETNIGKAIGYDSFIHGRFEDLGAYLEYKNHLDTILTTISIKEFIKEILKYSGNKQIEVLKYLLFNKVKYNERPWYIRVLLKNPRIGISQTTYNKIRIKCRLKPLEKFYVKLASLLEPDKFNTLNYPVFTEIKYDGERAVINYDNGNINITSRNGNNITKQFPEIVEEVNNYFKNTKAKNIILDGEIISKSFNSLQKRMNRLEKNINTDYDITFICFDLIRLDDRLLNDAKQKERRNLLEVLKEKIGLKLSEVVLCNTSQEVMTFYQKAINNKEEGIIIKEQTAKLATKDNDRENWYKVKPVYTSDLEIIKAEYGNGKNKDYINILYVQDYTGIIKTKVSSGMTDEMRKLFTNLYNKEELIGKIIEIKYNQVTETNSLRHPRIIKLRFDKDIAEKIKN